VLTGAGLDEAWTTTFLAPGDLERAFLDPDAVQVENPLDRSESLLRTSLLPGLLKALRFNVDRQLEDLALFEIGRVFAPPSGDAIVPDEAEHLAVAVLPPPGPAPTAAVEAVVRVWQWLATALRLETPTVVAAPRPGLHPGRSAVVRAGATPLGEVGEVDPAVVGAYGLDGRVGWLRLSLDDLAGAPRRPRLAVDISRYPAADFDLALVVADETPAATLLDALRAAGGPLLEDLTLFDVYRGERLGAGRRSLAVRARVRAMDRTLSDTDLAELRRQLIAAAAGLGAELRG
jgi:phenylalanyl-tRNA synthetase beta chain